jgi:hypothetical protein
MQDIKYEIGFEIFKLDEDREEYTVTGTIAKKYRFRDFESAYDLEEYIRKHIDCSGVSFDSEFCQFFAYTKTVDRAKQFVEDITARVMKIREMID